MTTLGVQLGVDRARAVLLTRWPRRRARTVELPFDPERPQETVAALRAVVGTPRRIAVAIDIHLLRTKRITLPALSAEARRNILRLEPDRFFAVRGEELVPAICGDDGLVFAGSAPALTQWTEAIEQLAPVDLVEPTPVALARGLADADINDALVVFDGDQAGVAIAEVRGGRVTRARRLFGSNVGADAAFSAEPATTEVPAAAFLDPWTASRPDALAPLVAGASFAPVPSVGRATSGLAIDGTFAAAYGAALGIRRMPPVAETLLGPTHATAVRRRRVRALTLAIAACVAAAIFAVAAIGDRRARAEAQLDAATTALADRVAPALAMQSEIAALARRAAALRAIDAERPDPLRLLRALSAVLPPGAFVRQLHGVGADWQVDGYAPSASAVLATLGADAAFRDVHFLSAMTQARVAGRTYENFSLAFRFSPAP